MEDIVTEEKLKTDKIKILLNQIVMWLAV